MRVVNRLVQTLVAVSIVTGAPAIAQTVPPITGTPVVDAPTNLLDWEPEFPAETPNLNEPTANRLNDLHGEMGGCDIAISTAGNYHMALKDLMQYYLHVSAADLGIKSWNYTTSPPVAYASVKNSVVQFGNLAVRCRPQIAVAPATELAQLQTEGFVAGKLVPVIRNYGNVILVKKGNPRHIDSVWDLAKEHIQIVTPNRDSEPGSFGNYTGSIYRIAYNQYYTRATPTSLTFCEANPEECDGMTPQMLFDILFNGSVRSDFEEHGDEANDAHGEDGDHDDDHVADHHGRDDEEHANSTDARHAKWLTGKRIHHREVPWSIAFGHADAGVIFYHLAKHAVAMFPDKFDIVPLGGTVDAPVPLAGNNVAVLSMACIKSADFTPLQIAARDRLAQTYMSTEFDTILAQYGLRRPDNFAATRAAFAACR